MIVFDDHDKIQKAQINQKLFVLGFIWCLNNNRKEGNFDGTSMRIKIFLLSFCQITKLFMKLKSIFPGYYHKNILLADSVLQQENILIMYTKFLFKCSL